MPDKREQQLRQKAIEAAIDYCRHVHTAPKKPFAPGDRIPYGGRIFDEQDMAHLVDASLDFWLTAGRYADRFEAALADFLGVDYCSLTNSGSSANLLAFMALTSPTLGERRIKPGDEVITVAAGFPTTVTPILQYGAVPVFVDVSLPTYNIDVTRLDAALSGRTRAVMVAHTLGNPFDLQAVKAFCENNDLWLIEDNCDALGSRYRIGDTWHYTGTVGHLGTSSFYPPHHMTTGEGGAVYTNDLRLKKLVNSFRDWGRDCWCASGHDNSCEKRFSRQFGELPYGYDHKYVYSHFGYNLKLTDMQAAIGCSQLEKLPSFIVARKNNWRTLKAGLVAMQKWFILPETTQNSDPAWFGFPITVKSGAPFTRDQIVAKLEENGIQTRMLFAGNLVKHPCFDDMRRSGSGFRIIGDLAVTDQIMHDTFWLGVYPGLDDRMLGHMIHVIQKSGESLCK
ncbi:CDP-4-dehydro-6-deoxyglucose dehydratase/reductase [Syntrophotalea carbinolica DSM 2380]|uniref:CDP-4-dehydro-6-deoxyglucose dehydratase/reductase n=1 Tax=Syntrophotalea carbinolica (strain DSM 2380 / NBRC 103641 / GraBd1) TaxID=338963 RepID=Q3A5H8_SYNC1|nr:lipopolysaccharide biosynthesis protein RfbH [Syntrophotalea carbinolica]ABA88379.1 CDP-4-dehydro-6-deoxyglucose dehydratase/reductase [Syntrophotalea carbinolica DSM 2380]